MNHCGYDKTLSRALDSVVAAIIIDSLFVRWKTAYRRQFILFGKPCNHPKYNTGLSWQEVSGLSEADLRYGIPLVGCKLGKSINRDEVLNNIKPIFSLSGVLENRKYLFTFKRVDGAPIYEFNEVLYTAAISAIADGSWVNYISHEKTTTPNKPDELTPEQIAEITAFQPGYIGSIATLKEE